MVSQYRSGFLKKWAKSKESLRKESKEEIQTKGSEREDKSTKQILSPPPSPYPIECWLFTSYPPER